MNELHRGHRVRRPGAFAATVVREPVIASFPESDPAEDSPRRVALVITRSDAVGGSQVHVQLLARGLLDAGHDVRVFVGGDGPWCAMLERDHIPYVSLRHLIRAIRPWTDVRGLIEVHDALGAFDPHVVSAHGTKAGWIARAVSRRLGRPSVFTVHGQPLSPGRLAPARRLVRTAEQLSARVSAGLIFVSDYDRRVAVEHGIGHAHQHHVVPNALPDVSEAMRADPSQPEPHIIMVARLDRPKDPLLAVRALSRVTDVPWRFTLVGDGPLRSRVESTVAACGLQSRVVLAGSVDDVPRRLSQSQVFLLASRREGLPMSVLEAMRAGLPVISTDAGGVREAVVDRCTGVVVPRDDAKAMAAALRSVLSDPALRVRFGEAGRKRFEDEYTFPRHLRRTWAVLRQAMLEGAQR